MPTYSIPAPRPNVQSTDPYADAAKAFMAVPGYANTYLAQQKTNAVPRPMPRPFDDPYEISDRDLIAGALTAEGGGLEDMAYIANVIHNRAASGRYPGSYRDVILQPGQFSAFNKVTGYAGGEQGSDLWRRPTQDAYSIADALIENMLSDQTGGALNYYNPRISNPAWGGQEFYSLPGSQHVFGTAR